MMMPRRTGRLKISAWSMSAGRRIIRCGRNHYRTLNDHRGRNHAFYQIDNIRRKADPVVVSMVFPGKSGSGGENSGDSGKDKKFFRIHNAHPFSQQSFKQFRFLFSAFLMHSCPYNAP